MPNLQTHLHCLPPLLHLVKPLVILTFADATVVTPGLLHIVTAIRKVSVPSAFLFLERHKAPRMIDATCSPGANKCTAFQKLPDDFDIDVINKYYRGIHRNLRGMPVRIVGGARLPTWNCLDSLHSHIFETGMPHCLAEEFSSQLNFTSDMTRTGIPWFPDDKYLSTVVMNVYHPSHLYESMMNAGMMNYKWGSACTEFSRFSYIQIFDRALLKQGSIWHGSDVGFYTLHASAMAVVVLALLAILKICT